MSLLTCTKSQKSFDGHVELYSHQSKNNQCLMNFGLFVPSSVENLIPVLWLSGLTCTETNFLTKAGALRAANEMGLLLIVPDTSPREVVIAGADDSWDFGSGASFYLNATQQPWFDHYQMYDYLIKELIPVVLAKFSCTNNRVHIMGHSMGGHGALVLGLRNPDLFASVSAFAPILNPSESPWGIRAFTGYLGEDRSTWASYDATCLVRSQQGAKVPLLVDQGLADEFLESELGLSSFKVACHDVGRSVDFRMREGYDHSYFYISTFIEEHFKWHISMR